jgi:hypothetical protein
VKIQFSARLVIFFDAVVDAAAGRHRFLSHAIEFGFMLQVLFLSHWFKVLFFYLFLSVLSCWTLLHAKKVFSEIFVRL